MILPSYCKHKLNIMKNVSYFWIHSITETRRMCYFNYGIRLFCPEILPLNSHSKNALSGGEHGGLFWRNDSGAPLSLVCAICYQWRVSTAQTILKVCAPGRAHILHKLYTPTRADSNSMAQDTLICLTGLGMHVFNMVRNYSEQVVPCDCHHSFAIAISGQVRLSRTYIITRTKKHKAI